jgi:hypothetical protein
MTDDLDPASFKYLLERIGSLEARVKSAELTQKTDKDELLFRIADQWKTIGRLLHAEAIEENAQRDNAKAQSEQFWSGVPKQ